MEKPLLSIIIVSYNTKGLLEECLQSVYKSKGIDKKELEVIVVDNNSTDESCEMVGNKFTQVKLIENKENIGFSAGNNIGIKSAKSEYILLLNSDVVVGTGTIRSMVDFMNQNPNVGAATCRVELSNRKLDPACHRGFPTPWNAFSFFLGLEKMFPKGRIFGGYHQTWKDVSEIHEVDVISGAFFLVRKCVIDKVGLLDEQFFMYGEDIDWCYRIRQEGWKIFFNPQVTTLHHKKQSGRGQNRDKDLKKRAHASFIDTMWQFYQKHYAKRYPFFITWLVKAGVTIKRFI